MKRDQENKSTPVRGKGSLKFQGYMGRKSSDGGKVYKVVQWTTNSIKKSRGGQRGQSNSKGHIIALPPWGVYKEKPQPQQGSFCVSPLCQLVNNITKLLQKTL